MMTRLADSKKLRAELVKLIEIFRSGDHAKEYKWWNSHYPNGIFKPAYGYEEARKGFEQVVKGVLMLNPVMLSEKEVRRKLVFEFLVQQPHQ